MAADYRLWCRDPQEMYRANVEGTRAVLEAAAAAGVRRVVCHQQRGYHGVPGDGTPVDEDSPVSLADMIGPYKRSKFMAEQLALQAPHAVVVNPTTPVASRTSSRRLRDRSSWISCGGSSRPTSIPV